MASAKVVLYTSKTLKNGEHPLMLRVIHNRKTVYTSLGHNIAAYFWDEKNNLPKKKHPLYHELTVLIGKRLTDCQRIIIQQETNGQSYTADDIIRQLTFEKKRKNISLIAFLDEMIIKMQSQNRFNYAAIHKGLKNHLLRYNRQREVHFLDINLEFLKGFDEHLSAHGLRPSGILVVMRTFKTTLNLAKKEQLVPTDYNPFAGIDFAKYTKEKPQKRALSRTVIQQIEAENCEFDPKIQFARDIFLFSYYCAGINFGDIARLTDVNLSSDGRLQYRRQKTGDQFDIKLLQPALEIIEKHRIPGSQHLFPIILKQHNTPAKQHTRIQGMLRSVNADLKRLAAHLDIKDDLTTYYARHSFATNLKHAGISTAIISQALGHESERVTQVYLDSFDTSVMDAAISNILVPSDK